MNEIFYIIAQGEYPYLKHVLNEWHKISANLLITKTNKYINFTKLFNELNDKIYLPPNHYNTGCKYE